jgi:hypothetical protein
MDSDEFREEIAQLEMRIETLAASRERCRKISLAAKTAIAAGVTWLVLSLLWVVLLAPAPMLAALAAVIGGIVLLGSNKTTWAQTDTALEEAEAMRAQMIERIELRVVGQASRMIH